MHNIKIEARKGHEMVADHLLGQIREGRLKPGQKLPSVVELAAAYGVGRSTIREAVSALKAMGWIDVRQGGGTYVKPVLPSELKTGADMLFQEAKSLAELLEVRRVLETGAAALAAQHRTSADLSRMREALLEMEKGLQEHDTGKSDRADVAFHLAIAAASGNSLLIGMMESLSERLSESIRSSRELWFFHGQSTASSLLLEHQGLYDAIEQQLPEQAGMQMELHLVKVERVVRTALETDRNG